MKNKILLYTFDIHGLTAYKALKCINNKNIVKYFFQQTDSLLKLIATQQFDHILGLGDLRRGVKKIRVDEVFINKYGQQEIAKGGKDLYYSTWDLSPNENIYFSSKPTNGPCNRSAYLVAKLIEEDSLSSKFAYIHIPKDYALEKILEEINNLIT